MLLNWTSMEGFVRALLSLGLLLVLACACAAWLTTLVTLPGNWIIVGFAALFAWLLPADDGRGVTWTTVAVLLGLAVARRGG